MCINKYTCCPAISSLYMHTQQCVSTFFFFLKNREKRQQMREKRAQQLYIFLRPVLGLAVNL